MSSYIKDLTINKIFSKHRRNMTRLFGLDQVNIKRDLSEVVITGSSVERKRIRKSQKESDGELQCIRCGKPMVSKPWVYQKEDLCEVCKGWIDLDPSFDIMNIDSLIDIPNFDSSLNHTYTLRSRRIFNNEYSLIFVNKPWNFYNDDQKSADIFLWD